MIRLNQLKLPVDHTEEQLRNKIKKELKLRDDKFTYEILKRSIDGRKKPELFYVYSIAIDGIAPNIISKIKNKNVSSYSKKEYIVERAVKIDEAERPLIIGAGPAGLFCAYVLCLSGLNPIIIERGKAVEDRQRDVEEFWQTGVLNTASNVQFGEGGAGTFSDGKLNTGVKDPKGRNTFVLETFVRFGADSSILYDNKPHIGTDVLSKVIINMRNYLLENGTDIYFNCCAKDFIIENNKITSVVCEDRSFKASEVVLALGHSARDTFTKLNDLKLPMEAKNFAVGFRVEHPQIMINNVMYGEKYADKMPASPYKVTSNFPNGRGVYSFCMCPGGYVVNSSSEEGRTVVNGMSYSGRNSANANSAIIVSVNTEDFGVTDPLAGMRFQRELEEKTYKLCNGAIPQQLFGDFVNKKSSSSYGDYESVVKGRCQMADLRGVLTEDMENSFIEGMKHFGHIVPNFDRYDAILSGVESRTSSPIRIVRGNNFESDIEGIFPCGEGAGYAGGITSAAMDGMKVAEAIIEKRK